MSITAILIVTAMYTIIYKHVILFPNRRVAPKRVCCMLRMWLVSCRALEQHRNWLIFQIVLPQIQRLRETERNLTADIDTRTIIDASNGPPLVLVLLVRRDRQIVDLNLVKNTQKGHDLSFAAPCALQTSVFSETQNKTYDATSWAGRSMQRRAKISG